MNSFAKAVMVLIGIWAFSSSYALSVRFVNHSGGSTYFDLDGGVLCCDLKDREEKEMPFSVINKVKNQKRGVGFYAQNSIGNCGMVDFNEKNTIEIIAYSEGDCRVRYY